MLRGLINLSISSGYTTALSRQKHVAARLGERRSLMAIDGTARKGRAKPPQSSAQEDVVTPRSTRKRALAPATPAPIQTRRLSATVKGEGVLVQEDAMVQEVQENANEPIFPPPKRGRTKKQYIELELQGAWTPAKRPMCHTTCVSRNSASAGAGGSHDAHIRAATTPRASAGLCVPQHDPS